MITSYKELSIGKYVEIGKLVKDESLDELSFQVKVLAILADKSEDEILNLPLGEYTDMVRASQFLEGKDATLTPIADKYVLGGYELVPTKDIRKIITAQYVDFQEWNKAGADDHMVEIISCFLVPKGKAYNQGYDIVEVQEAIRNNMSVAEVLGLIAFFLTLWQRSIKYSLNYSRREARKMKDKEKKEEMLKKIAETEMRLQNDGDGLEMWMQ